MHLFFRYRVHETDLRSVKHQPLALFDAVAVQPVAEDGSAQALRMRG